MKKGLFIIAGAALVLSSCQEDGIRNDINNTVEEAISFETFAQKAVRAENSGAEDKNGLAQYHDNFAVWGSKYINDEEQTPVVFENQLVKYASSDGKWQYSPVRFWDKSANKYDFYAAAPASESWVFDNTTKKFTLSNFSVDNVSLAVGTACSADAVMPNNKDIMIATDAFANPATDSKTKVHLLFNHILSRMNIAVKKGDVLKDYIVRLDKVMISEMLKTGSFDESLASGNALASGSVDRWAVATGSEADFGYEKSGDDRLKVASSDTYVYQGLIIPQTVDYKSIKLDGTDASGDAYILIAYTMYTASGDAEIAVPGGKYEYYYNLADIFNGNGAASGDAVDFCEGWMNTLKITINPDAIEFIADAYEWDEKEPVEVDVPDINK